MIDKKEAKRLGIKTDSLADRADADKANRIEQLRQISSSFINSDGIIDLNAIRDFFDAHDSASNNQGYELKFAGKGIARAMADLPTDRELKIEAEQSKNFDDTENIIIRGDNIDTLKLLRQNYEGKIKMIYIDPPYNTSSDNFIYKDNFKKNEEQLTEEYGLSENAADYLKAMYSTKTHSGWLAFMYPRLKLARELLTEDGVIFISIDDNEQANLKIICDEIFGENNFITKFVWRKKYGGGKGAKFFVDMHEYIFCYSKNIEKINGFSINRTEKQRKIFEQQDEFVAERGKFYIRPLKSGLAFRKNLIYSIKCPDGSSVTTQWICSEETFFTLKDEGRIVFKKLNNGSYNVYKKFYENDNEGKVLPESIIHDIAYNQNAKEEIKYLFNVKEGRDIPFETAKPINLICHLLNFHSNKNDIILDFFAGSGTTAHAVMALNQEDGGKRKFILAQWDEKIDPQKSKPAYEFCQENNLAPVISSICIERVHRAGEQIKQETDSPNLDIGYKVFSLTERPELTEDNGQIHLDIAERTTQNKLYNMMAASGTELTATIETLEENLLYKIKDSYFVLGECSQDLSAISGSVYIDGYADIKLETWLNLVGIKDQNSRIKIFY